MTAQNFKVATVQMVSGIDVDVNISTMQTLVRKAAHAGAKWVLLPEYWPLMGAHEQDKLAIAENFGEGVYRSCYNNWQKSCGLCCLPVRFRYAAVKKIRF